MSFVLRREVNREVNLTNDPGVGQESPKLWRPGTASSKVPQTPAPPQEPVHVRSKEDLFNFYETMHNPTGQDLSLKDIVERSTRKPHHSSLMTLRERDDQEGGAALAWTKEQKQKQQQQEVQQQKQQQQQVQQPNRHLFSLSTKSKVVVPPKANGEQIQGGHRHKKPFADFLENEPPRKSNAAETFHEAMSREVSPRRSRSTRSESRMPNASPMKSPRRSFGAEPSFNRPPDSPLSIHTPPARSPLRSPAQSPFPSPIHRASLMSSPSYPSTRRLSVGDYETGGRKETSNDQWIPLSASPPRISVSGSLRGASPLGEAPRSSVGDTGSQQQLLADLMKETSPNRRSFGRRAHPSKHCSACSSFTLFKTRCLVCGKIYCRNCVEDAMGDMPEGRKCTNTCLGKPIHKRYLAEAGQGCFCFVPTSASVAELRWAARRNDKQHPSASRSMSTSRSAHAATLLPDGRSGQNASRTPPWIRVA